MTIPRSISVLALIAAFAGLSQAQPVGKPASTTKKPSAKAVTSGARSRTSGSPSPIRRSPRINSRSTCRAAARLSPGIRTYYSTKAWLPAWRGRRARAQGAAEVINNIEPSEEARQKASANLTKGRRRAQIKRGDARSQ